MLDDYGYVLRHVKNGYYLGEVYSPSQTKIYSNETSAKKYANKYPGVWEVIKIKFTEVTKLP